MIPKVSSKETAFCVLVSRVLMPTKATSLPASASSLETFAKVGASARHGGHQEPQTLRTTTLPLRVVVSRSLPSTVSPSSLGASARSPWRRW